jgi:hypothetical protein
LRRRWRLAGRSGCIHALATTLIAGSPAKIAPADGSQAAPLALAFNRRPLCCEPETEELMDKKKLGLLGAVGVVAALSAGAQASAAPASYADLLQPIPNASEALKVSDANLTQADQFRLYKADHHHHNRAWWYWYNRRHRSHHHHNNYNNNNQHNHNNYNNNNDHNHHH